MYTMFQAICRVTGEIFESDSFKPVYRAALTRAKDYLRDHAKDGQNVVVIEFNKVTYSDCKYMNDYGYWQNPVIDREYVAWLAVSANGYTIDAGGIILDVDRGSDGIYSMQKGWNNNGIARL